MRISQQLKTAMLSAAIHRAFIRRKPPLPPPPPKHRRCFCSVTPIDYPPLDYQPQWSGLQNWRRKPLNRDRCWGPNGAIHEHNEVEHAPPSSDFSSCSSLAEMGGIVLSTADPLSKAKLSHIAYAKWRREGLPIGVSDAPSRPARPAKPQLVRFLCCFDWSKHLICGCFPQLCRSYKLFENVRVVFGGFLFMNFCSFLVFMHKMHFVLLFSNCSQIDFWFMCCRSCKLMEIVSIVYRIVFLFL